MKYVSSQGYGLKPIVITSGYIKILPSICLQLDRMALEKGGEVSLSHHSPENPQRTKPSQEREEKGGTMNERESDTSRQENKKAKKYSKTWKYVWERVGCGYELMERLESNR